MVLLNVIFRSVNEDGNDSDFFERDWKDNEEY